MLPHIPTPTSRTRFEQLAAAGRQLAELHVGYETVAPCVPLDVALHTGADPQDRKTWRVTTMKWVRRKDSETGKTVADTTAIVYNPRVTISGIPEAAERYMLGSRSALAWVLERWQVKTDQASGSVNDPNLWCDEHRPDLHRRTHQESHDRRGGDHADRGRSPRPRQLSLESTYVILGE